MSKKKLPALMATCSKCYRYTSISPDKTICERCEKEHPAREIHHKAYRAVKEVEQNPRPDSRLPDVPRGYIYLIAAEDKYYKVGLTANLKARLTFIKSALPFPAKLMHSFYCYRPLDVEAALHKFFTKKRLNGEWFALSPEDVEWFKALNSENVYQEIRTRKRKEARRG